MLESAMHQPLAEFAVDTIATRQAVHGKSAPQRP
jgi:hypothetical protein